MDDTIRVWRSSIFSLSVKRKKSSHLFLASSLHMEMEDHHHHHHHYGNGNGNGMAADLRQFMNTRPHFPSIPHHSDLFPSAAHHHHPHRNLTPTQPYDLMMVGRPVVTHEMISRGLHDFVTADSAAPPLPPHPPPTSATNTNTNTVVPSSNATLTGFDADAACLGADASTGRWPRQETLTLLEIRSRLDSKFKEANQKGPLWDEVSRYTLIQTFPDFFSFSFFQFWCRFWVFFSSFISSSNLFFFVFSYNFSVHWSSVRKSEICFPFLFLSFYWY